MQQGHRQLLRQSIAWPSDHGSWVFLLAPLIIGLAAGGRWSTPTFYLIVAAVSGFLVRQPTTIAVKALSGRRPRRDLAAALFWTIVYSLIGALHVLGLALRGFGYLLYLAIPGVAVYLWYLYLVSQREERRQIPVEILGSGVLALTAPAGLWVGLGYLDSSGWILWALTWAQSAASILYVHLRLEQRSLANRPSGMRLLTMGLPALTLASLSLLIVGALGANGWVARGLAVAYFPQWLETLWGTWYPAIGMRPTRIGYRQLGVSCLYTALFVITWS